MKPEARGLIKLLKLDAANPASRAALKTYFASTVRSASYPNLLAEDVNTLAVKAYLVTYDYTRSDTQLSMSRFGRSLCENFSTLQAQGHPKWKEVALEMPQLGQGWTYFGPTTRELGRCIAQLAKVPPPRRCTTEQKILGLCE
jgi:uncharacterized protein